MWAAMAGAVLCRRWEGHHRLSIHERYDRRSDGTPRHVLKCVRKLDSSIDTSWGVLGNRRNRSACLAPPPADARRQWMHSNPTTVAIAILESSRSPLLAFLSHKRS